MALAGGFAAFALVLVSVGTYGLTSCSVRLQRREIGIHTALGVSSTNVAAGVVH